jgi:PAS domain S-box-containing protein
MKSAVRRALKISGIYALFGLLWITVSDQLLAAMVSDGATISLISMYKGWFFIAVTAMLVFILSRGALTKQQRLTEEALLSEQQLRAMIETTDTGYVVLDHCGCVITANSIYVRMTGFSSLSDILGRSVVEWTAPYDIEHNAVEVTRCFREGRVRNLCIDYQHGDGTIVPIEINAVTLGTKTGTRVVTLCRDISDRRRTERERSITIEFLRLINDSRGTYELSRAAAAFFRQQSGCEAVGVRLKDGEDYPYYQAKGFPEEFLHAENSLCARDPEARIIRDEAGNPVIECMCGKVISGCFDPSKPFFTGHGSFWTNNTTELLASPAEDARQSLTLSRCNRDGYESVALVPLVSGDERFGLLQLNDRRRGIFSAELIALWERLAGYLGVALAKSLTEEALRKAEEKYLRLYQSMRDGFCLIGMDGKIRENNEAFREMLGYSAEELGRLTYKDIIPKKWHGIEKMIIEGQVIPRGYSDVHIKEYRRKDGTIFLVEVRTFLIRDEKGGHAGMWSIVRDVTERMRAEDAVRESEKRYHLLFQNMLEGCTYCRMIFDEQDLPVDFVYIYVNDAFKQLTGLKDVINRRVTEVIPGIRESNPDLFVIYGRVARTGRAERFEVYLEPLSVWLSVSVYSTETGFFIAVFDNITERKMAEEERLKLEAQLLQSQKMEAIGKLAGGVAHDFNNVINAIMGFCTLIQMKMQQDDPSRGYLEQILAASERAASLTRSLLAFSRKQIINVKPISLNNAVRSIAKLCENFLGEDLRLDLELSEKDIVVVADGGQLDQILMNLATNARDAMPEGGTMTIRTGLVEIEKDFTMLHGYGEEGKYAVITVEDTGHGMAEDIHDKIFEPFFTTKDVGRGTGLGLSIVYGIVRQHNGFIDVYSEPGKGASFKIYLPAVDLKADKVTMSDYMPSKGGFETILLVEDEPMLRKVTGTMLEKLGYKVIEAVDGLDAVGKFREHKDKIALVLMDVVMPRKNGKDAYQDIIAISPNARVIFMSGYTGDIISRKIIDDGLELILKPVSPRDLFTKIREVLDRGKDK